MRERGKSNIFDVRKREVRVQMILDMSSLMRLGRDKKRRRDD